MLEKHEYVIGLYMQQACLVSPICGSGVIVLKGEHKLMKQDLLL